MNARLIAASAATIIAGVTLAGSMFGTVKDEKGAPIANAEVKINSIDTIKTLSDANGKFKIESKDLLDGNKYSVSVSAVGYNGAYTLSVEMFDNPKDMDPIEITLSQSEPFLASWTNTVEGTNMTRNPHDMTGMRKTNPAMAPHEVEPANNALNTTAAGSAPAATNALPAAAKPAK